MRQAEGPGVAASPKTPDRAETAKNLQTATAAAAAAEAGAAETTAAPNLVDKVSVSDRSDHAQRDTHVKERAEARGGGGTTSGEEQRGRGGGRGDGRGGRGVGQGGRRGARKAKGGQPAILKEL